MPTSSRYLKCSILKKERINYRPVPTFTSHKSYWEVVNSGSVLLYFELVSRKYFIFALIHFSENYAEQPWIFNFAVLCYRAQLMQ